MTTVYDGKPSIILDYRPFFSIVVPCYNSGKFIDRLLTSIINQNMNDDLEVILADDHSTENYDYIVDKYRDKFPIKQILTDYNFAPGNTREKGASIAVGEWLTFIDHDDVFIDDALPKVKKAILEKGEPYYCITNFYEMFEDGRILRALKGPSGWTHGKFYNVDNLWKRFNVHYKKDLKSHEDIYLCSQINCIMNNLNREPCRFDNIWSYVWFIVPTSLTRSTYVKNAKGKTFLEYLFADYIRSTADVYFEYYDRQIISREYAFQSVIDVMVFSYFYIESFIFRDPEGFIRENLDIARNLLVRIKTIFNVRNKDIYHYLSRNDAAQYMAVFNTALIATGGFIPEKTLMEFLDYLHTDISYINSKETASTNILH